MRILVVSNLYPPNIVGGYERLCFNVASELARRGHDIPVLTSGYGGEVADYPRQRVQRRLQLLVGNSIYEPYPGGDAERAQALHQPAPGTEWPMPTNPPSRWSTRR